MVKMNHWHDIKIFWAKKIYEKNIRDYIISFQFFISTLFALNKLGKINLQQ